MYISKIVLENIRCFEKLDVDPTVGGFPVLFCGDNGNGKSTVLRCIAMGLCDVSSAAALFRELQGEFIRKGKEQSGGKIQIDLRGRSGVNYRTETTIKYLKAFEMVEQELSVEESPGKWTEMRKEEFPWEQIFVTAYGAGIRTQGNLEYPDYLAVDAVYPLFRYDTPLQSPELTYRRVLQEAREAGGHDPAEREKNVQQMRRYLDQLLKYVLDLESEEGEVIDLTSTGLFARGHWGECELGALGDGYKAITNWVLDLVSWWLLYLKLENEKNIFNNRNISGIVLIDEVEQHLHPKWQRHIINRLHDRFPNIQFIGTTHSPMVVAGTADIDQSSVVALRPGLDGGVDYEEIEPEKIRGLRADQLLTSEVFGLSVARSLGFEERLLRFSELYQREELSEPERREFVQLRDRLVRELPEAAETEDERRIQRELRELLAEVKRQLPG